VGSEFLHAGDFVVPAVSACAVCLGLGLVGTAKGRIRGVWGDEMDGFEKSVTSSVGRGVDMASEEARSSVDILVRPFGMFLEEGRRVNEERMEEIERIKGRSREIRRGVEKGIGGGYGGGFRD